MSPHCFVSYSAADGRDFAMRLGEELEAGQPAFRVWLDKLEKERNRLRPGEDWDEQLVEGIRTCDALLFVMTVDSVQPNSVCKQEWTRALKYKKPVIPIRADPAAETPFRLDPREAISFEGSFESVLKRLRGQLLWLHSPEGELQAMKYRLADAQRDLRRAEDAEQRARIEDEIELLERRLAEQQELVDDPEGAAKVARESIARGQEQERQRPPAAAVARSRFVNAPPAVAPGYFQDRYVETRLIASFLRDEAQRLLVIVGRGGIGKTALVCRLLKALESGPLPEEADGPLAVDGIVYLSATGTRRISVPNLYLDMCKLLPDVQARELSDLFGNRHLTTSVKMEALSAAFLGRRVVVLLDNFEDLLDPETLALRDAELDEALRALVRQQAAAVKVIITTRAPPRELLLEQPGRQVRLDLDEGLASPFAENILRAMDVDGKVGLRTAPDELLNEARLRTRGHPRALESLFAILSADRNTSLGELLDDTATLLPENAVQALVGEAFSRLDSAAQQLMQALAVYGRPVTVAAIDYLLQPYLPGARSASILGRLVNMQFARKEEGRYYLHPVDREYALRRVTRGQSADRNATDGPVYSQLALLNRAANYFQEVRTPRESWKTLADLNAILAEFDLRCEGEDYDPACVVLGAFDFVLATWGHYHLSSELNERLQGKLADPGLRRWNFQALGDACSRLGRYARAIESFSQALAAAREAHDRASEQYALYSLGWCHGELGETKLAIKHSEEALGIARETGDSQAEGDILSILGWYYGKLGLTDQAIELSRQAVDTLREAGSPESLATALSNLGGVLIDAERYPEAIERAEESLRVPDLVILGNWSNGFLALAHLFSGDLQHARGAGDAARRHDEPENNPNVLGLLGLICLLQGDREAATEAFRAAVAQADALLLRSAQNYNAQDAKGIALAGLALCEDRARAPEAIAAHRSARAINEDAGVIRRILRLYETMARADPRHLLEEVRAAAGSGPGR